jgi:hypothetical protein
MPTTPTSSRRLTDFQTEGAAAPAAADARDAGSRHDEDDDSLVLL